MSPVKPPRAVDTHAHVFSATSPAVAGARYRPAYEAGVDAWKALWPAAHITHGVVVQPSFFGGDNREMLETLAADPHGLRGVAVLSPTVDDATLARFHAAGVRAMRLNLRGVRDYTAYSTGPWRDLYDRVHAHGWHVEIFVDEARLPDVATVLGVSQVAVAFDHFGDPGPDRHAVDATFAAVARLARMRDVWCKLSAPYRLHAADPRALAARWLDTVGPQRLVWGSDWPWTGFEGKVTYGELRDSLDRWLAPELVPAVLWDNPARLYDWP
jgi:predicted TIM-barrel fold metal-dependent hydrolase